jgi:hypothetical protein
MKIGIISDTHNHISAVERALQILREEDIHTVLHCGDVCTAAILRKMRDFNVWVAEGNMDRPMDLRSAAAHILGRGRLARVHRLTLGGLGVGLLHGDERHRLQTLIETGGLAYVFHGHTHRRNDRQVGRTRVINPGALGSVRHQSPSFCIVDLESGSNRFIEL